MNYTLGIGILTTVFGVAVVIVLLVRQSSNRRSQAVKSRRNYKCLMSKMAWRSSVNGAADPVNDTLCRHYVDDGGGISHIRIKK